MDSISQAEFLEATQQHDDDIIATQVTYSKDTGRIVVELSSSVQIAFVARQFQGLETATDDELAQLSITPSGRGIYVEALDVDVYLPTLLQGVFGSTRWMASQMGKTGGKAVGGLKAKSSRENGKRGGRPKKQAA
jgi:hypothetical protein